MKRFITLIIVCSILLLSSCNKPVNNPETSLFPDVQYEDTSTVTTHTRPETTPPETEPPAEPPKEIRISFLAAGDNVIHPCIYMDAQVRATPETRPYNFKPMYSDVADYIATFDISFKVGS